VGGVSLRWRAARLGQKGSAPDSPRGARCPGATLDALSRTRARGKEAFRIFPEGVRSGRAITSQDWGGVTGSLLMASVRVVSFQ